MGSRKARTSLYCTPTTVPELCLYTSSRFVLATTDQETGIREPEPPAQGHTAGPGTESRAAWPALPSWGQGRLEMCRERAQRCLCLAERRHQLPTLRPELLPPSPTGGPQALAVPPSPGLRGPQPDTPTPTSGIIREGLLHLALPRPPGEGRGPVMLSGFCRSCLPPRLGPGWC